MAQRRCTKCGRLLTDTDFYTSNNIERFPPDGKMAECKKCWSMHVDNWDPDTYKPLLEQLDIPYIKSVWDQLLEKFLSKNDASKITTTSVLGRYVSTMKLTQWRKYRWADTEELAAKEEEKLRNALIQQGYTGEDLELEMKRDFGPQRPVSDLRPQNDDPAADPSSIVEETAYDRELADKLSEDEVMGLKLKWGDAYRLSELVRMEKLYADMMASYDIQTASHKDILIFLCKTSLKLNQLLDAGDIAEAQKVAKMYDTLLKSGKFELWTMKNFAQLSLGVIILQLTGKPKLVNTNMVIPWEINQKEINTCTDYSLSLLGREVGLLLIRSLILGNEVS